VDLVRTCPLRSTKPICIVLLKFTSPQRHRVRKEGRQKLTGCPRIQAYKTKKRYFFKIRVVSKSRIKYFNLPSSDTNFSSSFMTFNASSISDNHFSNPALSFVRFAEALPLSFVPSMYLPYMAIA